MLPLLAALPLPPPEQLSTIQAPSLDTKVSTRASKTNDQNPRTEAAKDKEAIKGGVLSPRINARVRKSSTSRMLSRLRMQSPRPRMLSPSPKLVMPNPRQLSPMRTLPKQRCSHRTFLLFFFFGLWQFTTIYNVPSFLSMKRLHFLFHKSFFFLVTFTL